MWIVFWGVNDRGLGVPVCQRCVSRALRGTEWSDNVGKVEKAEVAAGKCSECGSGGHLAEGIGFLALHWVLFADDFHMYFRRSC